MRKNIRVMRTSSSIDALFPRIRQAVLAATLLQPDRAWYLSDLAHALHVRPSSLQRELASLVEAGILQRRRDGNRVYFQADPACPFLEELQGLLSKTSGLADIVREVLGPFAASIDFAFIYGSVARGAESSASDVDLMIIGRARLAEVAGAVRRAESRIRRSINPTIYTWEEFAIQLAAGHHFLSTVMGAPKLFLRGNEHELAEALERAKGPSAHDEPAGP
jgi:predicted nucleotidyltransferase